MACIDATFFIPYRFVFFHEQLEEYPNLKNITNLQVLKYVYTSMILSAVEPTLGGLVLSGLYK